MSEVIAISIGAIGAVASIFAVCFSYKANKTSRESNQIAHEANKKSDEALKGAEADRIKCFLEEHESSEIKNAIDKWRDILKYVFNGKYALAKEDQGWASLGASDQFGKLLLYDIKVSKNGLNSDSAIRILYFYYEKLYMSYKYGGISKNAVIHICSKYSEYENFVKYGIFYLKTDDSCEKNFKESIEGLAKITGSEVFEPSEEIKKEIDSFR